MKVVIFFNACVLLLVHVQADNKTTTSIETNVMNKLEQLADIYSNVIKNNQTDFLSTSKKRVFETTNNMYSHLTSIICALNTKNIVTNQFGCKDKIAVNTTSTSYDVQSLKTVINTFIDYLKRPSQEIIDVLLDIADKNLFQDKNAQGYNNKTTFSVNKTDTCSDSCQVVFDGCNICKCNQLDKTMSCTKKYCLTTEAKQCLIRNDCVCPEVFAPVCSKTTVDRFGRDKFVTFSNACVAGCSGFSNFEFGACKN